LDEIYAFSVQNNKKNIKHLNFWFVGAVRDDRGGWLQKGKRQGARDKMRGASGKGQGARGKGQNANRQGTQNAKGNNFVKLDVFVIKSEKITKTSSFAKQNCPLPLAFCPLPLYSTFNPP